MPKPCAHCDGSPGSSATYAGQACLPINGKVRCIDWCIHQIVAALNAGGVETVASCCGHGSRIGSISLADGRDLLLTPQPAHAARAQPHIDGPGPPGDFDKNCISACPFCGSRPALMRVGSASDGWWLVICNDDGGDCVRPEVHDRSWRRAIRRWSHRA